MLTRVQTCRDCGNQFEAGLTRGVWPARCPSCSDIHRRRPSVIVDRTCLYGPLVCRIESLPGDWHEWRATPKDAPCFRIDGKGQMFGASWRGRIDLRAMQPFAAGAVVVFEAIEASHRVKAVYEPRTRSDFVSGVAVAYTARRRLPITAESGDAVEEIEQHRYVRLSAPDESLAAAASDEELPRLVWASAVSKTTIKGFGRQYRNELRGAPLWEQRISGAVRSGRKGGEASLALVDDDHPIAVVNVFDC